MNFDKLSPKDCVNLQVYLQLDNTYGFVEKLLSCNTCPLFKCVHILINICFIQEKSAVWFWQSNKHTPYMHILQNYRNYRYKKKWHQQDNSEC